MGTWFAGGRFLFDRLGFLERAIVKRIAHTSESVHAIDDEAIAALAAALQAVR